MNSFWQNVRKLLPYKDLEVKDLAFRAKVPYSTIINGMNKNSMPHADIALKISKILNTSLESLLGEEAVSTATLPSLSQYDFEKKERVLYQKYQLIIDALESLPLEVSESIRDLVIKMQASYEACSLKKACQ